MIIGHIILISGAPTSKQENTGVHNWIYSTFIGILFLPYSFEVINDNLL